MRYSACTAEDIAFLKTRVAGKGPNKPKLSSKRFWMSVIVLVSGLWLMLCFEVVIWLSDAPAFLADRGISYRMDTA